MWSLQIFFSSLILVSYMDLMTVFLLGYPDSLTQHFLTSPTVPRVWVCVLITLIENQFSVDVWFYHSVSVLLCCSVSLCIVNAMLFWLLTASWYILKSGGAVVSDKGWGFAVQTHLGSLVSSEDFEIAQTLCLTFRSTVILMIWILQIYEHRVSFQCAYHLWFLYLIIIIFSL